MSKPEQAIPVSVLCIGVGNEYRRDDGVGLVVARALQSRNIPDMIISEMSGEGTSLMEIWREADRVVLVDAVQSGRKPGIIYRFDAHLHPIPSNFFGYSTHAFSIAKAIELARILDQLPRHLTIYGIEGEDFGNGVGLSESVIKAGELVVGQILKEIREPGASDEKSV